MASTPSDLITIYLMNADGSQEPLEVPVNINLSLMEVLRAGGYPIAGTCGGIALCATCAVDILSGNEQLSPAGDQELDMLDLLPQSTSATRLGCQLRLRPEMDGMVFRITPAG